MVIEDDRGVRLVETCDYIGNATNNQAEYRALIAGLKAAQALNPERLEVTLDSELVVKQMNGHYKVKDPGLKLLHVQAMEMKAGLSGVVVIRHVARGQNGIADALANRAIDKHLAASR